MCKPRFLFLLMIFFCPWEKCHGHQCHTKNRSKNIGDDVGDVAMSFRETAMLVIFGKNAIHCAGEQGNQDVPGFHPAIHCPLTHSPDEQPAKNGKQDEMDGFVCVWQQQYRGARNMIRGHADDHENHRRPDDCRQQPPWSCLFDEDGQIRIRRQCVPCTPQRLTGHRPQRGQLF